LRMELVDLAAQSSDLPQVGSPLVARVTPVLNDEPGQDLRNHVVGRPVLFEGGLT
jgi:hypothetical protein